MNGYPFPELYRRVGLLNPAGFAKAGDLKSQHTSNAQEVCWEALMSVL
jgi:hypothetical protein